MCLLVTGAVELQKELTLATGLDLATTFVFDFPTIPEICAAILATVPTADAASTGSSEKAAAGGAASDPQMVLQAPGKLARKADLETKVSSQSLAPCPNSSNLK